MYQMSLFEEWMTRAYFSCATFHSAGQGTPAFRSEKEVSVLFIQIEIKDDLTRKIFTLVCLYVYEILGYLIFCFFISNIFQTDDY